VATDAEQTRVAIAEACRALARSGLVVGSAGNVSARVGDLIAVTPTGARLATLTPEKIALVDLDGTLVDGPLAPTSELPLHLAVYAHSDAAAVVHTHPPMAPYATVGTPELATSVVEALEGRCAAMMACHGAVTYGSDLESAVDATELLEWACGVYIHASACGTPRVLSEDERAAVAEALAAYEYGRTAAAR